MKPQQQQQQPCPSTALLGPPCCPECDVALPENDKKNVVGYEWLVALCVAIYWFTVSLIPIWNKFFFQKSMYPYPVATAGIQLGIVCIVLGVVNVGQHFLRQVQLGNKQLQQSWLFGPHLLWKCQWCLPIGVLFGLKYGVTNLGLHLIPAPTHLLLQSTDLIWAVLGAWWINGELVTWMELVCLVGCGLGSFVLGWEVSEDHSIQAPVFAILVNLLSPVLLGLCLATLRLACTELMRPDNRVGGSVSAIELTCIKLAMSSTVALGLACLMEDDWYKAFGELPLSTMLGVMGCALLIAIFQANCTFLTYLTSTVSVGLVGQVKIIPQWIAATIFATHVSSFRIRLAPLVGALLICASAAIYTWTNYVRHNQKADEEPEAPASLLLDKGDGSGEEASTDVSSSGSRYSYGSTNAV